MPITYNNLYLDIRQELRRAGITAATLEARELVCYGSGKTREELIRDGQLYVATEVEGRIHDLATRGIALSPGQTIADVYAYRTPLYERCAHLTVPADGQSLAETVAAVKAALARREQ